MKRTSAYTQEKKQCAVSFGYFLVWICGVQHTPSLVVGDDRKDAVRTVGKLVHLCCCKVGLLLSFVQQFNGFLRGRDLVDNVVLQSLS